MAGNANSGARPRLETIIGDAGMSGRLMIDQLRDLAETHNATGRGIARLFAEADNQKAKIDEALASLNRPRIAWDGRSDRRAERDRRRRASSGRRRQQSMAA